MTKNLDIIVFGASGFTGKYTLQYLHKLAKTKERTLSWGIAGRSQEKLKNTLSHTAKKIGMSDVNNISIIIANIEDEESIRKMTAQAKIIINCCGPYRLYGEVVVKACIDTGTHYVDIAAEPEFMEAMELKYFHAAQDKGVYIVSACGFGSITTDMGIVFLEENFKGTLNSVEAYLEHHIEEGFSSDPQVHYGTWASAVDAMGRLKDIYHLRKILYGNPLPPMEPKLQLQFVHKSEIINKWVGPLVGPLEDVVSRSQRYFYEKDGKRPVQMHSYAVFDSFLYSMLALFLAIVFIILSQFKFGRNLLLKYPEFFSYGFFSHKDPPEDVLERQNFSFTFYGKGWSTIRNIDDETPPNKSIVGRMSSTNPGYRFTSLCLTLSAIMILTQPHQLPTKGGVYTTAAAFSKTTLIRELQKNGVVFEIISN